MSRVRVHYNTHKKNYTVSQYIKGKGWRKCAEYSKLILLDPEFKVSQSGRERALREGKKNVHAHAYGSLMYVEGQRIHEDDQSLMVLAAALHGERYIRYNYKTDSTFVDQDNEPIHSADFAIFSLREEKRPHVVAVCM